MTIAAGSSLARPRATARLSVIVDTDATTLSPQNRQLGVRRRSVLLRGPAVARAAGARGGVQRDKIGQP